MTSPHAHDLKELRKALGAFVTGVTVIATLEANGNPRGFTANSFTSVSLDPPLILVCIAKSAVSYTTFAASKAFAVNILSEYQREISGVFASKAPDKFNAVAWRIGVGGSPLFEGVTGWFDCKTASTVDAGDHLILIGEIVDFGNSSANPLAYCRGGYVSLGLSQSAISAASGAAKVGAILERDGRILLLRGADGAFSLPLGSSLGPESNPRSLLGMLRAMGMTARMNFLFAVFENGPGESQNIYYRGVWESERSMTDDGAEAVAFGDVPFAQLKTDAMRAMLRRFIKERNEDAFSVYAGGEETGIVTPLAPASQPHILSSMQS
ncbi:MAG: flavin reductase family protein [Chitinophagales bacterium]|nr:flavin reductase family protein [Hyphomicrobiales bacterium]